MPASNDLIKILQDKSSLLILNNIRNSKDLSSLSKSLEKEESFVRRKLKSLQILNLIKNHEGIIELTHTGYQILKKIHGMEFLTNNRHYFLNHSINEIPHHLFQRIENFTDCEIVHGVWPVASRLGKIANSSKKFVNCIFLEPPFLLANPFYEKLQSGVKLKILFGKNSIIPDCNDLVEKLELNKQKQSDLLEKRMCDKVITNVLVSDKGGCLILGDKNNELDMINAIVGNDEDFIGWCVDFFEFKWSQGEKFAKLRTIKPEKEENTITS